MKEHNHNHNHNHSHGHGHGKIKKIEESPDQIVEPNNEIERNYFEGGHKNKSTIIHSRSDDSRGEVDIGKDFGYL